jgi:hypothetical protein
MVAAVAAMLVWERIVADWPDTATTPGVHETVVAPPPPTSKYRICGRLRKICHGFLLISAISADDNSLFQTKKA